MPNLMGILKLKDSLVVLKTLYLIRSFFFKAELVDSDVSSPVWSGPLNNCDFLGTKRPLQIALSVGYIRPNVRMHICTYVSSDRNYSV